MSLAVSHGVRIRASLERPEAGHQDLLHPNCSIVRARGSNQATAQFLLPAKILSFGCSFVPSFTHRASSYDHSYANPDNLTFSEPRPAMSICRYLTQSIPVEAFDLSKETSDNSMSNMLFFIHAPNMMYSVNL